MKPLFLSILLLCCLSVYQADGQQPFYDAELTQVCMDSAGVKTNLYGLNLYVFGRNSVLPRFFFDSNGNKVVPGGGVTLYDVPCQYLITEREADAISTESSFPPGFGYTIPADTYSSVTVTNIAFGSSGPFAATMRIGTETYDLASVSGLSQSQSIVLTQEVTFDAVGEYDVRVDIDPDDLVDEVSEVNNRGDITIEVTN